MSAARYAAAIALVMAQAASAGWVNRQGEVLPDSDSRKAVGDFGVSLILVADEKALLKRWATPSETVDLTTTDTVAVDQAIHGFIVFSGCTVDKQGRCSVAMRFRILQPDGKTYGETPPMEVWHDKPAPPGRMLELSADYLKVIVRPHEPTGRYTIEAQVRDNHSKVVIPVRARFTVVPRDGAPAR